MSNPCVAASPRVLRKGRSVGRTRRTGRGRVRSGTGRLVGRFRLKIFAALRAAWVGRSGPPESESASGENGGRSVGDVHRKINFAPP